MDLLLWVVMPLLLAPVGWYLWPLLFHATARAQFQPSLVARVQDVLSPYAGHPASAAALVELQRQVDQVVRDTLVDLHREFRVVVVTLKNDELLGPSCFVSVDGGPEVPLAEFEASLRT